MAWEEKSCREKQKTKYNDPQTYTLHYKTAQSAKCSAWKCDKVFQLGDTCVKVEGGISIVYGKDFAKGQTLYFCPNVACLRKPPVWTNIRFPDTIECHYPEKMPVLLQTLNDEVHTFTMV